MSDLADWLAKHDLSRYESVFLENDIDLSVLPLLTDEDLQSLGLSLGHRRKLQAAARTLAEPLTAPPESAPVGDEAQPESATVKPGPRDAEHRQLTVMFFDLVDSTGLSSQLDVESYSGVLRSYQDAYTRAVAPFEANVARLFGDGLLIYFGYPHAHEDDAERSVLAAFRIHRALEQLSRKLPAAASKALPEGLLARIGIATGPIVVGDIVGQQVTQQSTALGGTPNLAARLQGLAKAGETVVSSATHRLTERRFQFEPLGQQKVKGLDEPIQVWRATGELSGDSRFDITRSGQMLPMWGREFEQSVLLRYWHTAVGGAGTVVDIRGEAGIGKSRLIRSLREAIADNEHRVFSCQCSAWHSSSSLYPITSRLLRLAGIAVTDNVFEQREKLATALGIQQTSDHAARSSGQAHLDVLAEFLSINSETTFSESGGNAATLPVELSPRSRQ